MFSWNGQTQIWEASYIFSLRCLRPWFSFLPLRTNPMRNVRPPASAVPNNGRRKFLRLTMVGASALVVGCALPKVGAHTTPAAGATHDVTPQQALARLLEGNHRYVAGATTQHDFMAERVPLVNGQHPFAALLACADSRIAPEFVFDAGLGDLFEVRVAGNFVTNEGLASLEYAVGVLGTPLIVVLGHDNCGAVSAGIKATQGTTTFPGKIQALAYALKPSVNKVLKAPGNLLDNAIAQNVRDTVVRLKNESPLLADALTEGTLKIVGGIYRLHSGKVELLA